MENYVENRFKEISDRELRSQSIYTQSLHTISLHTEKKVKRDVSPASNVPSLSDLRVREEIF